MKKARDYDRLKAAGMPTPIYGVFDDTCTTEPDETRRLRTLVYEILHHGSGLIGIRTEPKTSRSPLGSYPHIFPLQSTAETCTAIHDLISQFSDTRWWFLINEAFSNYEWNAVVMLTDDVPLGRMTLVGEINEKDNAPLRPALAHTENCISANDWRHPDKSWLISTIRRGGIFGEWLEVSSVYDHSGIRKVFWGMR